MLTGIHHCSLRVTALEPALAFYRDILQLPLSPERPSLAVPGFWFQVGAQQLHLLQGSAESPLSAAGYGGREHHLALLVADWSALITRLEQAQIPYQLSQSGRRALFCRDPDGNVLECIAESAQASIATEMAQLITIREVIRWATSQFNAAELTFGHGTEQAFDEAVALVLPLLKLPYQIAEGYLDTRITATERQRLTLALQQRIIEHKPVSYITREAWFAGLKFYVDERVLIPRSPIAEMIAAGFQPWLTQEPQRILDLCTGSGCIAIACAYQFPETPVDAIDISPAAIAVAARNVAQHRLEGQVQLIESDLWQNLPPAAQYDLIVSNPPYVDRQEMQALALEYQHEPVLGLAAGVDGLDLALPILQHAADYLSADGILVLEVGASADALTQRLPTLPLTWVEFERGGEGVLVLTRSQLVAFFLDKPVDKSGHKR